MTKQLQLSWRKAKERKRKRQCSWNSRDFFFILSNQCFSVCGLAARNLQCASTSTLSKIWLANRYAAVNQSNSSPISHLTRQCRSCCKQNHWQLCLQSDWSIEMLRKTKSFEVYPQADWSMDILLQRKSIAAVSPSNRDVAGNKTNGSFISYLTGQWKSCCLQNQWKSISNLTGQCRSKINSSSVWLVHGDLLLQNQWRSTSTLTGQWRSCCLKNQWKFISNLTEQWSYKISG